MTLSQETRWAYSTTAKSTTRKNRSKFILRRAAWITTSSVVPRLLPTCDWRQCFVLTHICSSGRRSVMGTTVAGLLPSVNDKPYSHTFNTANSSRYYLFILTQRFNIVGCVTVGHLACKNTCHSQVQRLSLQLSSNNMGFYYLIQIKIDWLIVTP